MDLQTYVNKLYGDDIEMAPCPFTEREIAELDAREEMLVYVPKKITPTEMCKRWGIQSNTNFDVDRLVRTVMITEDQWFVTSAQPTPEFINKSALTARRTYEDEGLHGLDIRRYLAFAASYRLRYDTWPDRLYWTFLLSGAYDRSGISVVGFDAHGILNHHGWMRNFKSKFSGSRYAVIAPRIEITPHTEHLPRAYRGGGREGREADLD